MCAYLNQNADLGVIMSLSRTELREPLARLKTLKRLRMEEQALTTAEHELVADEPPDERQYLVDEVEGVEDNATLPIDNLEDVLAPALDVSGDYAYESADEA